MPPNVRFFAGFTSSVAFRYSVTYMIPLRTLRIMPPVSGISFFLHCSFRDFGCGKAMSFDDSFRKDRLNKTLRRNHSHENGTGNWRHKDPMNPSERIEELIADLTDWRGEMLAKIRKSILEADREIIEEGKWMGSPVWSRDGMIAVGNAHKNKGLLLSSTGDSLPDPDKLFNAGLEGNNWRAVVRCTRLGQAARARSRRRALPSLAPGP